MLKLDNGIELTDEDVLALASAIEMHKWMTEIMHRHTPQPMRVIVDGETKTRLLPNAQMLDALKPFARAAEYIPSDERDKALYDNTVLCNGDFRQLLKAIDQVGSPSLLNRPTVVCLCGSMRFEKEMRYVAVMESVLLGNIVVMPHVRLNSEEVREWIKDVPGSVEDIKANLDALHLRKIDLADELYVVNVDGYIGDSTRREIEYAQKQGKRIRYLEPIE